MADEAQVTVPAGETRRVRLEAEAPAVLCRRFGDVNFEFDRSFMIPEQALDLLKDTSNYANQFTSRQILIVGHTDTKGPPDYNLRLSKRRGMSMHAHLTGDTAVWQQMYDEENTPNEKWGNREGRHMLRFLKDSSSNPYFTGTAGDEGPDSTEAIKRFQRDNGLDDDGDAGPLTHRAMFERLVEALQAEGVGIAANRFLEPQPGEFWLGCGERHPAVPTGDEVEEVRNRRVEVLLFLQPPSPLTCDQYDSLWAEVCVESELIRVEVLLRDADNEPLASEFSLRPPIGDLMRDVTDRDGLWHSPKANMPSGPYVLAAHFTTATRTLNSIQPRIFAQVAANLAPLTTFIVRNRIINERVPNTDIEVIDNAGNVLAQGTTNAQGVVRFRLTGVPNGVHQFRVTPPDNTADPVGPAIAAAAPRPARIWRILDTTVTVNGGRIVGAGNNNVTIAGNTVTIRVQPAWMESPNHSARPAGTDVTLIIVHHTGGPVVGPAVNTFMAANSTSAHYVIDVDGQIIKMVPESEQAHHAGCSHWQGQGSVNRFSVGIEIVHQNGPYPAVQITELIALLNRIRAAHPTIPSDGIVGHNDIGICIPGNANCGCNPPSRLGRKATDPGLDFEWDTVEATGLGIVLQPGPLPTSIYGGFFNSVPNGQLRSGDNDANQRFGGQQRPAITTPVIAELQTDLRTIGYLCQVTGTFGSQTVQAVSMFQEHFFSSTRRRAGPGFRRGRVDQDTAEAIKFIRRPPGIISVQPRIGSAAGGTPITITGFNFQAGATVGIANTGALNVRVVSDVEITAETPIAPLPGPVDVEVINPDGQSDLIPGGFQYIP